MKGTYMFKHLHLKELKKYSYSRIKPKFLCKIVAENRPASKMFSIVAETWNPVSGCLHQCIYCWARRLAEGKLKKSKRYKHGFTPKLNVEEFNRKLRGRVIFVSDMGDLFGDFVPDEWIVEVLENIRRFPNKLFLFLTKNPSRYMDFDFPENAILGATIETDKDINYGKISKAPKPSERIRAMINLDWNMKFLSIEPILDFTSEFWEKIVEINPFMIYVGYDNYSNRLPEPTLDKTLQLIQKLSEEGFLVLKKTIRRAWYEGEEAKPI